MKRKELVENNGRPKKKYSSKKAKLELLIPCRCTQQKKKKNTDTAEEMDICQEGIIHFPEEIVMDILSRLPVRSLQRFKCVSPFWRSLISDHYFIMKHLNRANSDLNSQKLLACEQSARTNHEVAFNSFSLSSSPGQVIEHEQRLDGPPNCTSNYSIRCCCDGLVLLSSSDEHTDLTSFLLWNPSARESILLPPQANALRFCVFGLGYDATNDDYKILAAYLNPGRFGNVSVRILPLKSRSWRKIGSYPNVVRGYSNCAMSSLAFIHGAFHWLSYKSPCYTIISFNISTEVYGEIPLLDWMYYKCKFKLKHGVSVLRGMLCYYSTHNSDGRPSTFKLWTMKDYGVKESWIQWLAIRDIGVDSAIPHCVIADGEVLLRLKKFPPITSLYWTSIRGTFDLFPEFRLTIVYTESLISPKLLI